MNDVGFLIAEILPETAVGGRLDWVATRRSPYHSVDPVDFEEAVLDDVFDMYSRTYGAIDSRFNISNRDGLFEFNRWILIRDVVGNLLGFVLIKTTTFGLKVGLTASDGSEQGKNAVKAFHRRVYNVKNVYAEVSDALERTVKDHVPWVNVDDAEIIMHPKRISKDADGYHYRRHITGIGTRRKLMVGNPRIPPKSVP